MTNAITQHQDFLVDRFALKVTARLNESSLSHDITERLRVAREQAVLARKKVLVLNTATTSSFSGGAITLGGDGLNWANRIASALPLLALIAGLIAFNIIQMDDRARELADVDVQLLTDDLPPAAYADPGFSQYLKFGPPGQ